MRSALPALARSLNCCGRPDVNDISRQQTEQMQQTGRALERAPAELRPLVVQKYGGSSLADVEAVRGVARKVVDAHRSGQRVVVVVSAMGNTTDDLIGLAREIDGNPAPRELDLLLSSGERISIAVLAMAIRELGVPSVALTGRQAGIVTDDRHGDARIIEVRPFRIQDALERGQIVVVAGFQGESYRGELTTLGRGGSDTTAVALAAALGARHCDIFSDVDGVYSADPRCIEPARRLDQLCYQEMQELARHGARVLNAEAVEFARRRQIAVYARPTNGGEEHTVIRKDRALEDSLREVRCHGVTGVAGRDDIVDLRLRGLEDEEGLLRSVSSARVLKSWLDADAGSLRLLIATENVPDVRELIRSLRREFSASLDLVAGLGVASAVGMGCGGSSEALLGARRAVEEAGIAVRSCFTSGESISFVVRADDVEPALHALHARFMESAADRQPAREVA